MNASKDSKVDASEFKGILPAHMRQGIPPYLQVLFSARPKLPHLPPVPKPHPATLQGFFGYLNYAKMAQESDKLRAAAVERVAETVLPDSSLRTFSASIKKAKRAREWRSKMESHISQQKTDFQSWLTERSKTVGNRSYEPRNTLVVSKLVSL